MTNDEKQIVATTSLTTVAIEEQGEADVPCLVTEAGPAAVFAYEEFFDGQIRNLHTRRAYRHAVHSFLGWSDKLDLSIQRIAPAHVGRYLDSLDTLSPATRKLRISALRHFFDALVNRHVLVLNPAATVRTERLQVVEGKTPEITVEQARHLLLSINTTHVVGLRDRAIIATLIYTAARIGAIAGLKRRNLIDAGDQFVLRFTDKGGKSREIPVRHDLQRFLLEYLDAASSGNESLMGADSMFRTAIGRTRNLTANAMSTSDMNRMVKRRMRDAGLPPRLSPHSFRVATITDLLSQGTPLEDVQYLAGHADPRTTRLYDRRKRRVTRNVVERISI